MVRQGGFGHGTPCPYEIFRLIPKNSLHHEAHEDHEGISMSCLILSDYPKGDFHFMDNFLFFFVSFVLFVVQLRLSG
jgi:hypothetical protein